MNGVLSVQVLRMTVLNLSFAACGFLGIYHLGVAGAFLRHGDKLLGSLRACAGSSAGALVAAVMITAPDKLEVECSPPLSAHSEKKTLYIRTVVNKAGLGEPSGVFERFPEVPEQNRNLNVLYM